MIYTAYSLDTLYSAYEYILVIECRNNYDPLAIPANSAYTPTKAEGITGIYYPTLSGISLITIEIANAASTAPTKVVDYIYLEVYG